MASSCGFSLPRGPILPSCVRLRANKDLLLDRGAFGEVRSETGEKSAFRERDNTKKDKRLCPQDNQAVKETVNVKARAEVEAADADHRTVSA